jgi:glycosyltransferase involved in cell wall biosynthesis
MRILFVVSYYKPAYVYGGPARSNPALAEGLASLGHEVVVFTTNANGDRNLDLLSARAMDVDGVTVSYFARSQWLPGRYFYSPALGRACREEISHFDAAYISATWTYPMLPAARWARKTCVPYIISPRGSLMNWAMRRKSLQKAVYLRLFERKFFDNAVAIHCTSQIEVDQIRQWQFHARPVLIPNGVDLRPFRSLPPRGYLRRSLGIPSSATISLFVGRLHAMKRIDRTIEIFSSIVAALPDAHLVLAGPDEDRTGERARVLITQLGLAEHVHLVGQLSGEYLLQAYADADLLILLSHRENFGMVVVEAMAAGLPVLLSREVGVGGDVVRHGAGFVVDAESSQAEDHWMSLLCQPRQRALMAEAGVKLAMSRFSAEATARQMAELLAEVTHSQAARMMVSKP